LEEAVSSCFDDVLGTSLCLLDESDAADPDEVSWGAGASGAECAALLSPAPVLEEFESSDFVVLSSLAICAETSEEQDSRQRTQSSGSNARLNPFSHKGKDTLNLHQAKKRTLDSQLADLLGPRQINS